MLMPMMDMMGRTRVSMKLVSLNQFAAPAANDDFSSSEDSEDIDEVPYATICIVRFLHHGMYSCLFSGEISL